MVGGSASDDAEKSYEGGDVPRGEEGVSTRAGECMETLEHYVLKVTEGTEGVKSDKERKSTSVEFSQTEEVEPVLGPGHAFSLGPTHEDQRLRQARWWKSGLGEGRDADLGATRD